MNISLGFPAEYILKDEIDLIRQNDPLGLVGLLVATGIASYVIFTETKDSAVWYWLAFTAVSIVVWHLFQRHIMRSPNYSLELEALLRVMLGVYFSVLWAWSNITYLPDATPVTVVTLTMVSGALAAGSVAMQAPFLPLCFGFIAPQLLSITAALVVRGQAIDLVIAPGAVLFLGTLMWFAVTTEKTVRNAIELRYENSALIDQLRESLDATREANHAKSVFLASASHDLRQPLQAISLTTDAFASTGLDKVQTNLHGHLCSAVTSTREMLDSLLNFSKVDAGAITAKPGPFLVQDTLAKLHSELLPRAEAKNIQYRTRSSSLVANSDVTIIEMILRNLITNAIRYTASGGILVSCRRRTSKLLMFEVWDTGIGMSQKDIDIIFKEFHQIDTSDRGSKKGFGLGLAIAQGLAKTISSQITVRSALGNGSVFRFSVPISDVDIIDDSRHVRPLVDLSGKSVLVIDADKQIRNTMNTLLRSWGCRSVTAQSGEQALTLLPSMIPDVIFSDYQLSEGRTGTQAVKRLRTYLDSDVPAIIITGDTSRERMQEIQAEGMQVLHKPASTSQIREMIGTLID